MDDKIHWYDGLFYDKLIAPNQDKLFKLIKNLIEPGTTVIDIGCGTGRLPFYLSMHCSKVIGIDFSSKNIKLANLRKEKKQIRNVEFFHGDALKFQNPGNGKFDYAVITYVLHEMPPGERIKMLKKMKQLANKIIIGDYVIPVPDSFYGKLTRIVEFLAGKDHNTNFKDYVKRGGLYFLLEQSELTIVKEIKRLPNMAHLVLAE